MSAPTNKPRLSHRTVLAAMSFDLDFALSRITSALQQKSARWSTYIFYYQDLPLARWTDAGLAFPKDPDLQASLWALKQNMRSLRKWLSHIARAASEARYAVTQHRMFHNLNTRRYTHEIIFVRHKP